MEIPIRAVKSIDAEVVCPKSKGYTNRAILIAALAEGTSTLCNALASQDTGIMKQAAALLGAKIIEQRNKLSIIGTGGKIKAAKKIDCGNSGTTIRFCAAAATLSSGQTTLDGNIRMRERPIGDLAGALNQLGAKARTKNGFPPVHIKGPLKGGSANLKGDSSSQYTSAILMASPYANKDVTVSIVGELTSRPYVKMTAQIMAEFGAKAYNDNYRTFNIPNGCYNARRYTIEGDFANASYFFAAAAVTGGRIRVTGINPDSSQGESKFPAALKEMGCGVKTGQDWIELHGSHLYGMEIDMNDMPDAVQTMAVVAAFAKGRTMIKNVANLRIKETDRLNATAAELRKIGASVKETADGLEITPGKARPAAIETYNDHRMAMSFAVAGLRIPGITIRGAECVEKTFPGFFRELEKTCR